MKAKDTQFLLTGMALIVLSFVLAVVASFISLIGISMWCAFASMISGLGGLGVVFIHLVDKYVN